MKPKKKEKPQEITDLPSVGQLVWDLANARRVQVLKITETYGVYRILGCYEGENEVRVYRPNELQA